MDRQRTVEQAVEPMGAPRHAFDAGRFAASAQNTDEQAVRGVALVVSAAEDVADAFGFVRSPDRLAAAGEPTGEVACMSSRAVHAKAPRPTSRDFAPVRRSLNRDEMWI